MPRGAHQPLTFLPPNAGRRAAIVPTRPRPDFDEHHSEPSRSLITRSISPPRHATLRATKRNRWRCRKASA